MDRVCMWMPGNAEISLCGDAFDAFESGDSDEQFRIAESGDRITCEKCLQIIATVKAIKRNRAPTPETNEEERK